MEDFSPAGLHVLVVDDDPLCLMVLERMLQQCNYKVTTCNRVDHALQLLRNNPEAFDLVISDVYMPDVDGFKLLEIIGLELDLPVIMMSANGETSVVMKGITHGACDYLIKPVRMEELRNIWQHVVRRKGKACPRQECQCEGSRGATAVDLNEQKCKKRKEVTESADDTVEDMNNLKKARVNWSVQLHRQFVDAVNQLGVNKAVPKRILEIMNVQGLTRENVASHLQKYRLYLKRLSGVVMEPCPVASFQASKDGASGGTMCVLPGGKGSKAPAIVKGLNLGAGVASSSATGRNIDAGTMKSLAQFQASQQREVANQVKSHDTGFQSVSAISLASTPSLNLDFPTQSDQACAPVWETFPTTEVLRVPVPRSLEARKLQDKGLLAGPIRPAEGFIAPWRPNLGTASQDQASATSLRSLENEHNNLLVQGNSTAAPLYIPDEMSSTNTPHEPPPSSSTITSKEAFSHPFDILADANPTPDKLLRNASLDISDYLVDETFSFHN